MVESEKRTDQPPDPATGQPERRHPSSRPVRAPIHTPGLGRWLLLGALVPGLSACLAALIMGQSLVVPATLVIPTAAVLVFYARLSWNYVGTVRHVLGTALVTALVLVPVLVLIAVALVPGQLSLTGLLMIPLDWLEPSIRESVVRLVFGGLTGLVFMALIAAFQHTLVPGRMPEVPGWVSAHLLGGVAAGVLIALALQLDEDRSTIEGRFLAVAVLAVSLVPHALLTWRVWQRTIAQSG